MGHQEMLFKTNEDQMETLMTFIKSNKKSIENPPFDYCFIPSMIRFKQHGKGVCLGDSYEFKAGDTYFWAVGQRSAVTWIPTFLQHANFGITSVFIEFVPEGWLDGFQEYQYSLPKGKERGTFENDFVVIEPVLYDEESTSEEWALLTYELKEKGFTPKMIRQIVYSKQ